MRLGPNARFSALLLAAAAPALWLGMGACSVDVSLGPQAQGGGGSDSGGGGMHSTSSVLIGGQIPFDAGLFCDPGLHEDHDEDGYTRAEGDCDDCNELINPNAVEVIGKKNERKYDEDCDGKTDEIEDTCDAALAMDDNDPVSGAMALDMCKMSSGPGDWGLVAATWTMPDGSLPDPAILGRYHLGHGLLPAFGIAVTPRRGFRMLALSSGTARRPGDPGHFNFEGFDKSFVANHPPGFPKESPACMGVVTGEPHDAAAIELDLRTPSNAKGINFDFNFYTYEWPDFICSFYNDFFVTLLYPPPSGAIDANISFDSLGNPVSVNNAFLDVCGCPGNPPDACIAGAKVFPCSLGDVELIGTGFGFDSGGMDHGATSWLVTEAPVEPNDTITVRMMIYDSFDGLSDSLVLIDNLRWQATPATVNTQPIPK